MANTIRTPRQGTSTTSRRIAQAVDDEWWQRFRLSMKGKSTRDKLKMLKGYYDDDLAHTCITTTMPGGTLTDRSDCDVCIRLDNYIKALTRGGQLYAGENLLTLIEVDWDLPSSRIKRN